MKLTTRSSRTRRYEAMPADIAEWVPPSTPQSDLPSAVADAPLFAGMTRAEVSRALSRFHEACYPSGRRVVLEGLRGSDFFLIVAGMAAVLVDGCRVTTLGPGDFFGEMAVLGDGYRTASVRAETPLHCLILPNGTLEEVVLVHPQIGVNVRQVVTSRLSDLARRRQPRAAGASAAFSDKPARRD